MSEQKSLTYADAGVNRDRHYELIKRIGSHTVRTNRAGVLGGIGGFGGLFAIDLKKYPDPILVSGTDGVGTKLKLAFATGRHDTIGQDLVAMCVNDILTSGAEPLFFLDYIGTAQKDLVVLEQVVKGVADGCLLAGCALVGGETAELPGMYAPGEYDMAGFSVGVVNRDQIITGGNIKPGDVLVGLASSGLHSNGYSLARRVLVKENGGKFEVNDRPDELGGKSVADELLTPTRIYCKNFLALRERITINGASNITGGGFHENVPRMLPTGARAIIRRGTWPVLPVFELISRLGPVDQAEMESTFNMGVGMILCVPAAEADATVREAQALGEQAWIIGEIVAGETGVEVI